jgi:hypothetical protein
MGKNRLKLLSVNSLRCLTAYSKKGRQTPFNSILHSVKKKTAEAL